MSDSPKPIAEFPTSDLHFDTGSARLSAGDREQLASVAEDLKLHPEWTVELRGHADPTGPTAYNQALSMNRARAAKSELETRGVDPGRMGVSGRGEVPENDWTDGARLARDRNVEIRPAG